MEVVIGLLMLLGVSHGELFNFIHMPLNVLLILLSLISVVLLSFCLLSKFDQPLQNNHTCL